MSIPGEECLLIAHWHYSDLSQASGMYLIGMGVNTTNQIVEIANRNIDFSLRVNSNHTLTITQSGQNRGYSMILIVW